MALVSVALGVGSGLLATAFRLTLLSADGIRTQWIVAAKGRPLVGFVLVVGLVATAAMIAAWLVRRFAPTAGGSGIPQVEAALAGGPLPQTAAVVPVKFIGGVLAIGGGLALGREGPSVQMGAQLGLWLGKWFRMDISDCRALLAAGGGAGLATAFNAPIAGAVFVLEELVRRFDPRTALAALGASAGAIAAARWFLGQAPDFALSAISFPSPGTGFLFFGLGLVAGVAGVLYNRGLLVGLRLADACHRVPVELRAAFIGGLVGAVAWLAPDWVGGGDPLTQRALSGQQALTVLPVLFVVRFVLSLGSYCAGTPGGLFAPLLVLGAQLGLLYSAVGQWLLPSVTTPSSAFAVVGMAALFVAVVRAPATGIILVTELTGNVTLLLPILAACFGAMLIPLLSGDRPIYDSLRERVLRVAPGTDTGVEPDHSRTIAQEVQRHRCR
ncbi:MAG TPA: H(+)/Cl(-) exchange transporter ClcA [Verrucomicrobiales bacterium]|nr:H(+)/Cl(-) exchange transporter ClcA [Verrucomicrobiales bacterium]